ncbi:uncharacterized protein TNCV_3186731 [Trichonephila clavipes]|nr:uncharacterized protein TNCV_3186731 [Trichonephila clavipes]
MLLTVYTPPASLGNVTSSYLLSLGAVEYNSLHVLLPAGLGLSFFHSPLPQWDSKTAQVCDCVISFHHLEVGMTFTIFTNIIEKNAAILFNRLIRLPNNSFWRDYDSDGGRNLKTQKGFIQCVRENIQYKVNNDVPFELLSFANPLDYATLDIRLDLVLNVRKRDLSPTALHAIALETINTLFPPEEWLHIYTDGSLLDFAQGAGIGVFSHFFSFYLHAVPLTTHFDASRVARDKPWSTLCKKSRGIPSSPRAAVAKFRLLTGHDCLCAHLFRFNLVTSPICVLCDTGQDMTAAHLDECSALNDLNCIVKRKSYLIMINSDDYEYANLSKRFSDDREYLLRDGSESEVNDDEFLAVARNWYQINTNQPNVAIPRFPCVTNLGCSFKLTDYDVLT